MSSEHQQNGHRRPSQSSDNSIKLLNTDSTDPPLLDVLGHVTSHPGLELRGGLAELHRGLSLDQALSPVNPTSGFRGQQSFSKDDLHGYARDVTQSNVQDVSQISSVQVTPRPKQRSFPRTNPAYVGVANRRDGAPSYKRVNIEHPHAPTAIYNQRFYPATQSGDNAQGADATGYAQDPYPRFERSDSDASHSSYAMNRLAQQQGKDSVMASSYYKPSSSSGANSYSSSKYQRDPTDSHSSQGSLRAFGDSLSSQGSIKSSGSRDQDFASQRSRDNSRESQRSNARDAYYSDKTEDGGVSSLNSSPRHLADLSSNHQHHKQQQQSLTNQSKHQHHANNQQPLAPPRTKHHMTKVGGVPASPSSFKQSTFPSSAPTRPLTSTNRNNDAADYANVSLANQTQESSKVMTLSDLLTKRQVDREKLTQMTSSAHTEDSFELKSADSLDLKSGDSMKSIDAKSGGGESLRSNDSFSPAEYPHYRPAAAKNVLDVARSARTERECLVTFNT